LSKPDDPPSLKLRRDRSAFVKTSAVVPLMAGLWRDKPAGQATREHATGKAHADKKSVKSLAVQTV
jgi:hypothetical protein